MALLLLALQQTGSQGNPVGGLILIGTIVVILMSKRKLRTFLMVLLAWAVTIGVLFGLTFLFNLNEGVMGHTAAPVASLVGLLVAIGHKRHVDRKAGSAPSRPQPPEH